jgi:hypothetical protein
VAPSGYNYTTYQGVAVHFPLIEMVVADCVMPPANAGQLSSSEKQTLLEWTACSAPDN